MNREEKAQAIAEIRDSFKESNAAFVVDYKGLSVFKIQQLRNSLRGDNATLKVSKVRLMLRAAEEAKVVREFSDSFGGQIALVFANKDVPCVAKKLVKFAEGCDEAEVVSGFFESRFMDAQAVTALATLPSREELLARCAGALNAPIAGLARTLSGLISGLARSLKCVAEASVGN
ncbi:50S ribosomal protein L10 [Candidatus Babeliales bacterium]|nr:50S ribosomal protein L10 [Candidatus Babeliales bacterium]